MGQWLMGSWRLTHPSKRTTPFDRTVPCQLLFDITSCILGEEHRGALRPGQRGEGAEP